MGLGSHKGVDKFRCAHGHAHAGHARDIDNVKLRFSKVHFIEFTETLERRVLIDVPDHKFAGSFSADIAHGGRSLPFGCNVLGNNIMCEKYFASQWQSCRRGSNRNVDTLDDMAAQKRHGAQSLDKRAAGPHATEAAGL
jgi:hypothetical protein